MKRKDTSKSDLKPTKNDLCYEEDIEEIALMPASDEVDGTLLSSFSFSEDSSTFNRTTKNKTTVETPKINGESYSVNRYYKLRYSTAKMLNEIKAAHEDVNVYMNTIVDEAIRHYYSFLFSK